MRWPRPTRRALLGGGLAAAGLAAFGLHRVNARPPVPDGPVRLNVEARRIDAFRPGDPGRQRFGALVFRGGLQLKAGYEGFGGFSGLAFADDGRLVAISDAAEWLVARPERQGDRLVGLAQVGMAPMLAGNGVPLAATSAYDTESLTIAGGTAYVGVERVHQILKFDWARSGVAARAERVAVPDEARRLPRNRGLEAIGVAPRGSPVAGAIVAIAERSGEDETAGFIIGGRRPGRFAFGRRDGFDVTDLAFLPGGDLIVLERRYVPPFSIGMRIRHIEGRALVPGAVLDGTALIEADNGYEIDNMEGLAVRRGAAGETILTVISDNNFSMMQRTLLLEFALAP